MRYSVFDYSWSVLEDLQGSKNHPATFEYFTFHPVKKLGIAIIDVLQKKLGGVPSCGLSAVMGANSVFLMGEELVEEVSW